MNEIRLKEFWEKGYTIIPGAVSAEIVAKVLRKAPKLKYRSMFKEVFSEQFDAKQMQAPFPYPSVKAFMDMAITLKRDVIKKANMRWKDKQWNVLKSLPGGESQAAHRNFPGIEISKAREQYDTIQAAIIGSSGRK